MKMMKWDSKTKNFSVKCDFSDLQRLSITVTHQFIKSWVYNSCTQ